MKILRSIESEEIDLQEYNTLKDDLDSQIKSMEEDKIKLQWGFIFILVVLNKLAKYVPNLIGGAADLAPSTKTYMKDLGDFSKEDYTGRN